MDDDALKRRIAARKAEAQRIATDLVIACERAASRRLAKRNMPAKWDDAAWRRYIRAATQAPHISSLACVSDDIKALEQLAAERQRFDAAREQIREGRPCLSTASCSSKNSSSATAPNSSSTPRRLASPPRS